MAKYENIGKRGPISFVVGFVAFFMFLSFFIFDLLTTSVSALIATPSASSSAYVAPTLAVAATDVLINISPTASEKVKFATGVGTVTVTTNNETGYTLTMADAGGSTSLEHELARIDDAIESVSNASGLTSSEMLKNTWGYALTQSATSSTKYLPIPGSSAAVTISDKNVASDDSVYITYGVKAENTLVSGMYRNHMVFTATTKEVPTNFYNIRYMQEMTSDICDSVETPEAYVSNAINDDVPETTLTDIREGGINSYTVRKLADGNCWMVENLRLGSSGSAVSLTSSNTDLNSNYRKTNGFTLPAAQTSGSDAWGENPYSNADSAKNLYYNSGTTNSQTIGGYYSWYTAVAYSGTSYDGTFDNLDSDGTAATDSICPFGWKLPENTGPDSYANLITTVYGLLDNDAASSSAMINEPLSFAFSGSYQYSGGVSGVDASGFWWSSTSAASPRARQMSVYSSRIVTGNGAQRGYGLPIRCVARKNRE